MPQTPVIRRLQPLEQPAASRVSRTDMSRTDSAWHDVNAALTDPNLRAAAVFAIIGLLASLCLTLLLPLSAVTAVLFAQLT